MKKAIVLMVIGKKHQKFYNRVKNQFIHYAEKCDADLKIIEDVIDSSFYRPLLAQKLLIPAQFTSYDMITFMDIDVLISPSSPSIFDVLEEGFNIGAVIDPRESQGFLNTCKNIWKDASIVNETHLSYFLDRGFEQNENLIGSINGGVFVCRPKIIGELFVKAYWSDLPFTPHEEAIMAYISQTKKMFQELDIGWNNQVMHYLGESDDKYLIFIHENWYFKIIFKLHKRFPLPFYLLPKKYLGYLRHGLLTNHILHFSGGYPLTFKIGNDT